MNSEALEHPGNFKCLPFVDFQKNPALNTDICQYLEHDVKASSVFSL